MDTLGAVMELVTAAVVIYLAQVGGLALSRVTYQRLALISIIPAVLAILILLILVQESSKFSLEVVRPVSPIGLGSFDTQFKIFLVATFYLGAVLAFLVMLGIMILNSE